MNGGDRLFSCMLSFILGLLLTAGGFFAGCYVCQCRCPLVSPCRCLDCKCPDCPYNCQPRDVPPVETDVPVQKPCCPEPKPVPVPLKPCDKK